MSPSPLKVPSPVNWKWEQPSFGPVLCQPCSLLALGSCVVRGNAIDFELVSKFRFQRDIEWKQGCLEKLKILGGNREKSKITYPVPASKPQEWTGRKSKTGRGKKKPKTKTKP